MNFKCLPFYELSHDELYACMALRQEVFVVEQDCPYLDADGRDQVSHHVLGFDEEERLIAYARIVPKGVSYENYVSIGRVVTSPQGRGKGAGKELMRESIEFANQLFNNEAIKISAQTYLLRFYQNLGFETVGEEYLEDNIPHIAMIRK